MLHLTVYLHPIDLYRLHWSEYSIQYGMGGYRNLFLRSSRQLTGCISWPICNSETSLPSETIRSYREKKNCHWTKKKRTFYCDTRRSIKKKDSSIRKFQFNSRNSLSFELVEQFYIICRPNNICRPKPKFVWYLRRRRKKRI